MRVLLVATLLIALPAAAQVQASRERPLVLSMDQDIIEGSLHTPDVVLTPRAPHATHRTLIRIRQSFSQELLASASKI